MRCFPVWTWCSPLPRHEDGIERPIAYVSRTLNAAEKNYSQVEKEGLAIVFGVKKFHNYIYGREFETDHQPLAYLFGELRGIPQMASARIQRWALILSAYLSAYQYKICYKAGKSIGNADALSRLPCPVTCSNDGVTGDLCLLMNHLSATTVCASSIKDWTNRTQCCQRYNATPWLVGQVHT